MTSHIDAWLKLDGKAALVASGCCDTYLASAASIFTIGLVLRTDGAMALAR
jgi:hypothetical protein